MWSPRLLCSFDGHFLRFWDALGTTTPGQHRSPQLLGATRVEGLGALPGWHVARVRGDRLLLLCESVWTTWRLPPAIVARMGQPQP